MKAVVFHALGYIRLEDVPNPSIEQPTDAIVRLTASGFCGTDLHFVRGTVSGTKKGRILEHEGVGVIEQLGPMARNFSIGDRVIIPSTIGCGTCCYCREGYYAQCDNANPGGKTAGTAFFGGPEAAGGFDGLQAEKARVPRPAGSEPISPTLKKATQSPSSAAVPSGSSPSPRRRSWVHV
ncbi:MAG TPA: alcohol dehydrogenase catalytic domain-containing protein [Acetobacteraceae bacterium]|nr:alcohol dehydrogenase catalytic domain-containing protein [Acetobacteraceae bacterium]